MLKPDQIEEYARLALELATPIVRQYRTIVDGPDYESELDEQLAKAIPRWEESTGMPFRTYIHIHTKYACLKARRAHHLMGSKAVTAARAHPARYPLPERHAANDDDDESSARMARPDPVPDFEADESFRKAISPLSGLQRRVATLRYREGFNWGEIAAEMGKSRAAVKKLHFRMRIRMKGGH